MGYRTWTVSPVILYAHMSPPPMCMPQVVMVPDPNLEAGLRGRAHLELGSLAEFDPGAWGLPPYTAV